ncbi:S8 family serine peptidase [Conexibacter sp. W3-3-2]|uniref:S8 family serine peptidase n=1 Tax=Conexibacter sp. W3-3-2 TaxID=2675227 RepID=UPI0018AB9333|nr:S8 family serine peptidase [Conexibacter sp. W3-3-2]
MPFIDPADLPGETSRGVVCLVDTGVAVSADLPSDRPAGPVVERLSLYSGADPSGEPTTQGQHGSRMGLIIGAQANGVGTIGATPIARMVSLRATRPGESAFRATDYEGGVARCARTSSIAGRWPVAAVNLSLGSDNSPTTDERTTLESRVGEARGNGVSVVAAAGNTAGAPNGWPATADGVIAVAAGTPAGGLCGYASYSPGTLVGPGCGIDTADGEAPVTTENGGSSSAAAFTSAIVAALRSWRPAATPAEVEGWLRTGARTVADRPVLDVAGAFRAAGLGGVVDRATARRAAQPQDPAPSATTTPPQPDQTIMEPASAATPTPATNPKTPRLPDVRLASARWVRGRVVVVVRNRPTGARVEVSAQLFRGFRVRPLRRVTVRSSRVSFRVTRRPDRILVRFVGAKSSGGPREYLYLDRRNRFR